MLSKYLHRKAYVGTVLTVKYLPSGEHKYYDHVLTFKFKFYKILSTFQVNNSHVTMHM